MKKKQRSKRRAQRQQRRQTKRRQKARARSSDPNPRQFVTLEAWFDEAHDEDDNCPWCRAERELGIVSGEPMTQETYDAFRRRVDEIIAEEGMPEDAIVMTGEAFWRRHDWISARLRERGEFADFDQLMAMSDPELARHMDRVSELADAYDRLN